MASTSCNELAAELLAICLNGERWPDAFLDKLTTLDCSDAFFRVVVERLADLFDPRYCDTYADLFSEVIARSMPDQKAADLRARYDRVRWPRKFQGDARRVETVFVLSRVTLGADVAVTSVLLDAAKRRFPKARIVIVGSKKSYELFAGDSRIAHAPVTYRRAGSLQRSVLVGAARGLAARRRDCVPQLGRRRGGCRQGPHPADQRARRLRCGFSAQGCRAWPYRGAGIC